MICVFGIAPNSGRGHALRQRLFQAFNKRIFKRRKHFVHFVTAGHDAARRQHDAVIKSFTNYPVQHVFQLAIPPLFVQLVLIVIKKVCDAVLLTDRLQHLKLHGKITDLFVDQRNTFFNKRVLQNVQM